MIITRRPTSRFVPPVPTKPSLFFDIETLPTDDPEVIQILSDKCKPPGNYSKPDTIAAWERDEKPKMLADAISKTGLDGTYGRICCIGWAHNAQPVKSCIGDEREVLQTFFDAIASIAGVHIEGSTMNTALTVVGHNMRAFDLRFVWKRATILKLKLPKAMPWNAGYWDERVQDTPLMWDPDPSKRISLDRLCKVLGVKSPKNGFDGSMVADAWLRGEHKKIATYCEGDVDAMRECWWRMRGE